MAWEEVKLDSAEDAAIGQGAQFYKFTAIGQKLVARVVGFETRKNSYGREERSLRLKTKNDAGVTIEVLHTPGAHLEAQVNKANLRPGNAVLIQYTGDRVIEGKDKPMRLFSLKVDRSAAPGAAAPAAQPKPTPAPVPADDIGF